MAKANAIKLGEGRKSRGVNKGVSILDFIFRILAFIGTLSSAISMATTNETLPFFTRFFRFRAEYNDLPTLTFLWLSMPLVLIAFAVMFSVVFIAVADITDAIAVTVGGDLTAASAVNRGKAKLHVDSNDSFPFPPKPVQVELPLFTSDDPEEWIASAHDFFEFYAVASAAAAIVYLAHKGNSRVNWLAICQQFNVFFQLTSGFLIGSFSGIVLIALLITLSGVALARRP
ncbi:hypothetical protein F3Y22_tig00113726pilonHSYRG00313 [Hibiscus syriacus]|uniref:CASP-like protein n=1 Tax=Hibiscus syriacus TaxID=106335 RepID=A0A6A2WMC1_HIBSY|nr:hypothetical protein F3Y22_tig00113726pilonHSYRG00313 [Hibiscus syriacus]